MAADKKTRRRGVVLSLRGQRKLESARQQLAQTIHGGERLTLEDLSEHTQIAVSTMTRLLAAEVGVDKLTLEHVFGALNLHLEPEDYQKPVASKQSPAQPTQSIDPQEKPPSEPSISPVKAVVEWGEAIDVSTFYGRDSELTALKTLIQSDRCREIALLGMGGIGKTALSIKLAQTLIPDFEFIIWRSLRNAPSLETLLTDLVAFLSRQQETKPEIGKLLTYLRESRCLVILDNLETLLDAERVGQFRAGFEAYGELLRLMGEVGHQSCILLTSREKPAEIAALEGVESAVQSFRLDGSREAAQAIFHSKGLIGTTAQQQVLGDRYSNSPLALKIVATSIQELFGGNIVDFLQEDTFIFNGIRRLLDRQFQRLSPIERSIMYWLAINRDWSSIAELQADIVPAVSKGKLLESLEALSFRCVIEQQGNRFTQQPVVMEYITECILDAAVAELSESALEFLTTHALIKATAKDYIRQTQTRLILEPLSKRLLEQFPNSIVLIHHLQQQFASLRPSTLPNYGAGNLLNLLSHLQADLTGADLSGLTIRQAYLRDTPLRQVNLSQGSQIQSVFAEALTDIWGMTISPDGSILTMTGGKSGMLFVYEIATGRWLHSLKAHNAWTMAVTFDRASKRLLTGSVDRTIHVWDLGTGECLRTLQLDSPTYSLATSPDDRWFASTHEDGTVHLWDMVDFKCIRILAEHGQQLVTGVDFHPNRPWLATSGHDCAVKLWNYETGECLATWNEQTKAVWSVKFNPEGTWLASASCDGTAKLWDVSSRECLATFEVEPEMGFCLAFTPDSQAILLAWRESIRLWDIQSHQVLRSFPLSLNPSHICLSPDGGTLISIAAALQVQLWDLESGRLLKTLEGKLLSCWSIAFDPQGRHFASGSDDGRLRLWDIDSGQCLKEIAAHNARITSIAYHAHQPLLATCSYDRTIKLWNSQGNYLRTFIGHESWATVVMLHPDLPILISGSYDATIRWWDLNTGQLIDTSILPVGSYIYALALHPQNDRFLSSSDDGIVRLWDVTSRQMLQQFLGHQARIWTVAFHPQGHLFASGSHDGIVKIWELESGDCIATLDISTSNLMSVNFSPNGQLLAIGCDHALQIWDFNTQKCLQIFDGHTDMVSVVMFQHVPFDQAPDGLVSASLDETIRFWDIATGKCLKVLRPNRLYEGMDITGFAGLGEGQKTVLKQLGAIENQGLSSHIPLF